MAGKPVTVLFCLQLLKGRAVSRLCVVFMLLLIIRWMEPTTPQAAVVVVFVVARTSRISSKTN